MTFEAEKRRVALGSTWTIAFGLFFVVEELRACSWLRTGHALSRLMRSKYVRLASSASFEGIALYLHSTDMGDSAMRVDARSCSPQHALPFGAAIHVRTLMCGRWTLLTYHHVITWGLAICAPLMAVPTSILFSRRLLRPISREVAALVTLATFRTRVLRCATTPCLHIPSILTTISHLVNILPQSWQMLTLDRRRRHRPCRQDGKSYTVLVSGPPANRKQDCTMGRVSETTASAEPTQN
ncbi:hypothetical protein MRB53_038993 [Persea americana]|nr:hypothetical protein MRB53_038993 [Persea americana]